MSKLFFGDLWSMLSTIFLLGILIYMIYTALRHKHTEVWGKKILILAGSGLILCIFAVMRDDYVAAMQGRPGLFSLESLQINFAYIGSAVIGFSVISSLIIKNQKYRKLMFFVLAAAILFKIGLIEISRMMML